MKAFKIICAVLLAMSLTGCAGMFTGGGWIDSDGGGKANFGFNADSCDYNPFTGGGVTGHFDYHDMMAGVKMNGRIVEFNRCPRGADCDAPCEYWAKVEYRSTVPPNKGTGWAYMCAYDGGEGANAADFDEGAIYVDTGPFEDYFNTGVVRGNLQSHECP